MSCLGFIGEKEDPEAKRHRKQQENINREIERQNKRDYKIEQKTIRLLLLGTGESGKSTISKQMKIIHINGFNNEERQEKIVPIKKNIRDAMACIVAAMDVTNLDIAFETKENGARAEQLLNSMPKHDERDDHFQYTSEFFDDVDLMWQDKGVRACYERSNEYQLIDCAKYFLDKVSIVRDASYSPTDEDILRCRVMTNTISSINFEIRDHSQPVQFRVFDVGGQKGERKKWIQLFSDCTAILFLADSSSFDQTLKEDVFDAKPRNRLIEAFDTFRQVWTNRYLQNVSLLLFINKIDRLEEKIRAGKSIRPMLEANRIEMQQNHSKKLAASKTAAAPATAQSLFPERTAVDFNSNEPSSNSSRQNSTRSRTAAADRRDSTTSAAPNINDIIDFHTSMFDKFSPMLDDVKEFESSFPSMEQSRNASDAKQKHSHGQRPHPDTVKTAVFIKNIFMDITKTKVPTNYRYEYNYHTTRYYYTCAVNTDNVQKVLEGCRAFVIERHLERFGIL